jgi:hypothetical protein
VRILLTACLLALALPAPAPAQALEDYDYENLEFRGIGVDGGGIWPARVVPTAVIGVRADLGFVGPRVRISPAIRFWSSSLRESEVERLADQILRICDRQGTGGCPTGLTLGEVKRSDLELSTDAHYLIPTGYTIEPYLGGGLGLHLLNGRGESIDDTFVEDLLDTVSPALNLLGGVNVPLGRAVQLVTEARFVLVSDVQYASLVVGGTWALPSPPGNPWRAPLAPAVP